MESTSTSSQPPSPKTNGGTWMADFMASIVVFMVALPLCVAIAEASGYPPEAGIITGVIGGIVVGFLAGSPLQVSGPAAGLIVIVAENVTTYGLATASLITLLAGVLQLIFGAFRFGQWFRAVSPAVVLGMLAGIGAIILAKQFHVMFDRKGPASVIESYAEIPHTIWAAINPEAPTEPVLAPVGGIPTAVYEVEAARKLPSTLAAGITGIVTIVIMIFWKPLAPGKLRIIPGAVVGVLVASILAAVAGWDINKVAIEGLIDELRHAPSPPWEMVFSGAIWGAAITLALIASAETLLCATAVDSKHTGPRTLFNRELLAQGFGNILCGWLGALPMTGVIVRSSANLEAGAKTRRSAILHGVWLFLFVAFLDEVLAWVPIAALAGVLVYTGWKLLDFPGALRLWRISRVEAMIYAVTAIAIVVTDLLTGVLTGVAVAAAVLLHRFSNLDIRRVDEPGGKRVTLYLQGAATFIRLPRLAAELESIPPDTELHVRFEELSYVDHACLDLLINWEKQHAALGGKLEIDWVTLQAKFEHGISHDKRAVKSVESNGQANPVEQSEEVIVKN
jgi:MFS superfamily sulfate permease-like transporter